MEEKKLLIDLLVSWRLAKRINRPTEVYEIMAMNMSNKYKVMGMKMWV